MSYHREVLLSRSDIYKIQMALGLYMNQLHVDSEKYKEYSRLYDEMEKDFVMFCLDCSVADEELNEDNVCYTCELKRNDKEDY
jgi:hypothetical protein